MIFVSAGHYPSKPGAGYEGFFEHDEAVKWQNLIIDALGGKASFVPAGVLKSKVDFINSRKQDDSLAMEIHFNAARDSNDNPIGRGCETLYYPDSKNGKTLATAVNDAMAKFFPPDRGIKEGWYRMNPKNGPDFFLKRTHCPAIIIEPDFIHRRIRITTNREEACDGVADALLQAQISIYGDSK